MSDSRKQKVFQTMDWLRLRKVSAAAKAAFAGNAMKEMEDVNEVFAACLRKIYKEAGIDIPMRFYPEEEADRLVAALRSQPAQEAQNAEVE